jgi:eukaryotic-like serine/threonine-protein kinase
MTPERWGQVAQIYEAALEREPATRAAFVAEACGCDEALRGEIDALLAQEDAPLVLDRSMEEVAAAVLTPESALPAETQLGPYRIERLLDAGGMGQVYRAIDTRLNRAVAIKVLPPALADDAQFRARFDREAQTIAGLAHPHICTLHDVGHARVPDAAGTAREVDYLVFEYL